MSETLERSLLTDPHRPSPTRPGVPDPVQIQMRCQPATHDVFVGVTAAPRTRGAAKTSSPIQPPSTTISPAALDEHVPQRVGLLDTAQVTPAILLGAGNIEAVHHRTGGEQQLAVVRPLAGRGPGGQAGRTRSARRHWSAG
jgi:hypothetical protein